MKFLTKQEELILLTIYRLGSRSYLVEIRESLIKNTKKDWSISTVYVPLDRLQQKGYLDAIIGTPEPKRGGKAIKYYQITDMGLKALAEIKTLHDTMWEGISGLATEG